MTLLEITEKLGEMDRERTIYAVEPWAPESAAVVDSEPQSGGVPVDAARRDMAYFLEVFIALDFLEDWQSILPEEPSPRERCQRLIDYAINDA